MQVVPSGGDPDSSLSLRKAAPSIGSANSLKTDFLSRVGKWAASVVPPLGALLGSRLASTCEAVGVPSTQFSCSKCETILEPGVNCTLIKWKKWKIYKCNYCGSRTPFSTGKKKKKKPVAQKVTGTPPTSTTGNKRIRKFQSLKDLSASKSQKTSEMSGPRDKELNSQNGESLLQLLDPSTLEPPPGDKSDAPIHVSEANFRLPALRKVFHMDLTGEFSTSRLAVTQVEDSALVVTNLAALPSVVAEDSVDEQMQEVGNSLETSLETQTSMELLEVRDTANLTAADELKDKPDKPEDKNEVENLEELEGPVTNEEREEPVTTNGEHEEPGTKNNPEEPVMKDEPAVTKEQVTRDELDEQVTKQVLEEAIHEEEKTMEEGEKTVAEEETEAGMKMVDKSESMVDKSESMEDKSESMVDKSETMVDKSETMVDKSATMVDKSETMVDKSETMVDKSETMVDKSETMVDKSETMVAMVDKSETMEDKSETKSETINSEKLNDPAPDMNGPEEMKLDEKEPIEEMKLDEPEKIMDKTIEDNLDEPKQIISDSSDKVTLNADEKAMAGKMNESEQQAEDPTEPKMNVESEKPEEVMNEAEETKDTNEVRDEDEVMTETADEAQKIPVNDVAMTDTGKSEATEVDNVMTEVLAAFPGARIYGDYIFDDRVDPVPKQTEPGPSETRIPEEDASAGKAIVEEVDAGKKQPNKLKGAVRSFLHAKRLQSARHGVYLGAVKRQFKKVGQRLEKSRSEELTLKLRNSTRNFLRSKSVAMAGAQFHIANLRRQVAFLPSLNRRLKRLSGEMIQVSGELRRVVNALDVARHTYLKQTVPPPRVAAPEGNNHASTSRAAGDSDNEMNTVVVPSRDMGMAEEPPKFETKRLKVSDMSRMIHKKRWKSPFKMSMLTKVGRRWKIVS